MKPGLRSYALTVDLGALRCGRVRRSQIINRRLRHYQVGRGIADEVLRDPCDSGAGGLAEIRAEPWKTGEPHVLQR